jgi:hypothetical protein
LIKKLTRTDNPKRMIMVVESPKKLFVFSDLAANARADDKLPQKLAHWECGPFSLSISLYKTKIVYQCPKSLNYWNAG